MTYPTLSPSILDVRERESAPSKRWKNKWFVLADTFNLRTGERYTKGDTVPGTFTYPSKDVAETHAAEDDTFNKRRGQRVEWVGAFPLDGEGK